VGSSAFLFQFEEIGCRIASNTCGGLWRQCLIGNNVQRLVSPTGFNDDNFEWQEACKPRKVEDYQLQALLDEDDTQSQKMLAEQLDVSQVAISMRLHAMGKVQKIGKWMPMNWTIGRWSDAKTHAKFCLPDKKENHSCIGLWQAMKSGSIFRILNARNLGLIPPNTFLKTKSLRTEDDAVRLVGSRGSSTTSY